MKKISISIVLGTILILTGIVATTLMSSDPTIDYTLPLSEDSSLPLLTEDDKENLMTVAETAMQDYFFGSSNEETEEETIWPAEYEGINNNVYIVIRREGLREGAWYTQTENLAETVYDATYKNLQNHDYNPEDIDILKIHIYVMGDYKPLNKDVYQAGIHGLRLESDRGTANYYNTYALENNYDEIDEMYIKLCEKAGLDDYCQFDDDVEYYMFNSIHFATTRYSNDIVTLYRGNTVDFNTEISKKNLEDSLELAENWLIDNVESSGKFIYVYNPSNGTYSENNNMIRQLMGSRLLAEMSQDDKKLRALHRDNINYMFDYWYEDDGTYSYILWDEKSKLGANAMALRALVYSPYFDEYEEEAQKLAEGILYLQNEDGSFNPWFVPPSGYSNDDYLLTFYSGEALLALVDYYEKTGDETYLEAAIKSQEFYLDEYVENLEDNYYPAYVPWHTQSLNKLYQITGDYAYADAIFILNDELLKIQNQDKTENLDFLGRFYNPEFSSYGSPHSASDAVYVEGLAYAYEIAILVEDSEHAETYREAILLGAQNLINLQFRDSNVYYLNHPERVLGGIRFGVDDNRIRIDTTQHTIDAWQKILSLDIL